ncbi:MAG: hypothetical protein A2Y25_07830 [Candidatus Melainabacteria bacterium GWF2_37_15]|nr:MAG: hypothetical protein A2Y25_07830 [Candidatus Melainabacteria bacterium GWF2_37_15]
MKKVMIIMGLMVLLVQPVLAQPQRMQSGEQCPNCTIQNPEQKRERIQDPTKQKTTDTKRSKTCPNCPNCPCDGRQQRQQGQ